MGRTILCNHCKSTINEDILVKKDNPDICPVCGESLIDDEVGRQDNWITWYYYGFFDKNGNKTEVGCLEENPIDLNKFGDKFYLIKEFQAPPEDANGDCDAVKEELRKYVPDAFSPEPPNPAIRCPICGSKEYTLMNKGFSILTGFLGSGRIKRICNYCKREF